MLKLTVIAPVFNEEDILPEFYRRTTDVLVRAQDVDYKILFVVDKCEDQSLDVLRQIAYKDSRVSILALSSRFGHQMCLIAGIEKSQNSDIIIMMDSDLQHPPELIPKLIEEYHSGAEVVYTFRSEVELINPVRRIMGNFFYFFIGKLSDTKINPNSADFRLITGRVAKIVSKDFRERNVFLRGLFSSIGFNQRSVSYVAEKRLAGKTKYSSARLIQFALSGIISFSTKPLMLGMLLGLFFSICSFIMIIVTMANYFFDKSIPSGYTTIVTLLLLFNGVQFFITGILGAYIGDLSCEIKNRPRYIVEDETGSFF
jgi:glycosyltransferase involved in cell wall biosynthesis